MTARYTVGGYWRSREEPAAACAARLARFLADLSGCGDVFAAWYRKGGSRAAALDKQVDWRRADILLDLVREGASRTDSTREVIPDLGFHVGLWNGRPSATEVGLSVCCGLYTATPGLCNTANLDLPSDLGVFAYSSNVKAPLLAVVRAWEPEWAGVFSVRTVSSRRTCTAFTPYVDWLLYLQDPPHCIGSLPEAVATEETNDGGLLVILKDEAPQPSDIAHRTTVEQVGQTLGIPT